MILIPGTIVSGKRFPKSSLPHFAGGPLLFFPFFFCQPEFGLSFFVFSEFSPPGFVLPKGGSKPLGARKLTFPLSFRVDFFFLFFQKVRQPPHKTLLSWGPLCFVSFLKFAFHFARAPVLPLLFIILVFCWFSFEMM